MSRAPTTNNNRVPGPPISEETLKQLIETQTREQALRSQELQIRAKEIDHQSKHASEILGAQERDREKGREHNRRMVRGVLIALGIIIALFLIFVFGALYINKDQVVLDIVKLLIGFIAGGAGGYGLGKSKSKTKEDED